MFNKQVTKDLQSQYNRSRLTIKYQNGTQTDGLRRHHDLPTLHTCGLLVLNLPLPAYQSIYESKLNKRIYIIINIAE